MLQDLRYALRQLATHRGFAAVAVLTLALGVGASIATFSFFDAAVLRPAPFPESGRLVIPYITAQEPGQGAHRQRWSYQRGRLLQEWNTVFDAVGSTSRNTVNLTEGETPERLGIEIVSSGYFRALQVSPLLGRTFSAEEDSPSGVEAVVVVGHSVWQRRWGGSRSLLGQSIHLYGVPVVVIGIMPPGFAGITGEAELWIPPALAPILTYSEYLSTNQNFISAIARLRPGVSVEAARSELGVLGPRIEAALPSDADVPGTRFGATLIPLNEARVDPANRRGLAILVGAVGLVLLLACANIANLLLGRAIQRRREIAVRLSLGASRARIVRQLVTESAVLAMLGTAGGLLLAAVALATIRPPARGIGPSGMYGALAEFASAGLNLRMLLVATAAAVVTTLVFGLAPALGATRVDLIQDLRGGSGDSSIGWRGRSFRSALVVVQVALAFVLTVGAGLLATTLRHLSTTPLGFDPELVLSFRVEPSDAAYPPPRAARLHQQILANLAGIPGVVAATIDGCTPLMLVCASSTLFIEGRPVPPEGQAPGVLRHYVGPDHFRTLGIAMLRGRVLTAEDRAERPGVVVINETAARRFWPGQDPIGARVWFGGTVFDAPDRAAEVVGVVADTPDQPLGQGGVQPAFYSSYLQFTWAARYVMVRTVGDPIALVPEIRRAVLAVDPGLPVFDIQPLGERVSASWARTRFTTTVLTAFAALALALAAVGIYGVLAHAVNMRRREMGIRLAVGGTPGAIKRLVLSQAMLVAGAGIVLGVVAALAATRVLRALLYGVSPTDPWLFLALTVFLALVSLAASYVPARRASRVEPVIALRSE